MARKPSFLSAPATVDVITDIRIWKLDTEIKTITVDDPEQYLKKPLFHAQQSSPNNQAVAGSIGDNLRLLNTIKTNEISGASLSSNIVTLPAGTYYIEGWATAYKTLHYCAKILVDDVDTLVGTDCYAVSAGSDINPSIVNGRITLTSESEVKLVTYHEAAGNTVVTPTADPLPDYISADLRIWREDAVVQQPKVYHQPVQPISGAYVTGNIFGGELEYVDGTTFNVKPVSCMSDDLTVPLAIDATTLVDLGTPTLNTVYNAFIVKTTGGAFEIHTDTDVDGANLTGITHKRWLGFVRANASGAITPFTMSEDSMDFRSSGAPFNIGGEGVDSYTTNLKNWIPTSRVSFAWVGINAGGTYTSGRLIVRWETTSPDGESWSFHDMTTTPHTTSVKVPTDDYDLLVYSQIASLPRLITRCELKR